MFRWPARCPDCEARNCLPATFSAPLSPVFRAFCVWRWAFSLCVWGRSFALCVRGRAVTLTAGFTAMSWRRGLFVMALSAALVVFSFVARAAAVAVVVLGRRRRRGLCCARFGTTGALGLRTHLAIDLGALGGRDTDQGSRRGFSATLDLAHDGGSGHSGAESGREKCGECGESEGHGLLLLGALWRAPSCVAVGGRLRWWFLHRSRNVVEIEAGVLFSKMTVWSRFCRNSSKPG